VWDELRVAAYSTEESVVALRQLLAQVCLQRLRPAKTADRIDVLFVMEIPGDPKTPHWSGVRIPGRGGGNERGEGEWVRCGL